MRVHLRAPALTLDRLAAAAASFRAVVAASLRENVVAAPTSELPTLIASVDADRQVAVVVGLMTVVPPSCCVGTPSF